MKFDMKNEVQRKIFIRSVSLIIAIIAFLVLTRINDILGFFKSIISILAPFLIGFGLAFLLDGPIQWMSNRFIHRKMKPSLARGISTALIFTAFVLFILFALWVMIPSMIDSISVFVRNFSSYTTRFENMLAEISARYNLDLSQITTFLKSLNLERLVNDMLHSSMETMVSYSINAIHWVANLVISIAAAVYMVLDKKNLLQLGRQITYSLFGRRAGNFVVLYSMDAKNVFQQYIVGNILDSTIVGFIAWFGCLVFGLPYAPMIGLIIGITNIIPVFGPFLGAIPVILLLVLIEPMYALIFAIFILVLQQIDGNVLKPLILGDKLGLSGFWILFSVSVGGALFGPIGMFLGVPIFALIYEGLRDLSLLQLKEKHISLSESSAIVDDDRFSS